MDFPSPTRYQHSRHFYRYCISNHYTCFHVTRSLCLKYNHLLVGCAGIGGRAECNLQWGLSVGGSHLSCCYRCSTSEPVLQRGFVKQGKGTHSTSCLVSWRRQTPREILQLPKTCSFSAEWIKYLTGAYMKAEQKCKTQLHVWVRLWKDSNSRSIIVRLPAAHLKVKLVYHWIIFQGKAEFSGNHRRLG